MNLHLPDVVIGHRYGHVVGTVEALKDGEVVGWLDYDPDGFVAAVEVKPAFRRQGIATAMADYLRDVIGLRPSFGEGNTPDGDAWIAAYQDGRGF